MSTPTKDVLVCPAKRPPGVIIGFKNPTELVYHYTTVKTARDYIVAQRKLKLGSIRKTNDPKETQNWTFTLGTNRGANLMEDYSEELSAKMTNALKEFTKVACFCQDTPPLTGNAIPDVFSRGWTKPRLWSHYASEHRGVCLAFNRTRLDAAIRSHFTNRAHVYAGEVSYVNRTIPYDWRGDFTIIREDLDSLGFDAYVQSHIKQSVWPLFFEKMADWRDEREFRWLVFDNTGDDVFGDISDSLEAIMYGQRTRKSDIVRIMQTTRDLSLCHMGLKWTNSSPWYDFVNPLYQSEPMIIDT